MNKKQRENSAKYLYDLSKIVLTIAVIGNVVAGERFNLMIFLYGIVGAALTFIWAYRIDGRGEIL